MTTPRDAVQFTRESADRIAGVVRTLELTPARGAALNFDAVQSSRQQKVFRMATFTGTWAKGASKMVTFLGVTATVSAANLFAAIPAPASSGNCAIAKDGTAWYLIAAECD
jgi:hypothetical protein